MACPGHLKAKLIRVMMTFGFERSWIKGKSLESGNRGEGTNFRCPVKDLVLMENVFTV